MAERYDFSTVWYNFIFIRKLLTFTKYFKSHNEDKIKFKITTKFLKNVANKKVRTLIKHQQVPEIKVSRQQETYDTFNIKQSNADRFMSIRKGQDWITHKNFRTKKKVKLRPSIAT